MSKRYPLWAGLTMIAVLAVLLSLSPVRAWASDFLGLFRVEKVTVIPFNPSEIQASEGSLSGQEQVMEDLLGENLEVTGNGEAQKVETVEEASAQAGFTPRLPVVPDEPVSLYVKPGAQVNFTIDQPKMQAIFDAMNMNIDLPAAVDGAVVRGNIQNAVMAAYGSCPEDPTKDMEAVENCTLFLQLPSPTVEAPSGLDVPKMGEAMLQFLGFSPEEAASMSASIDWASTLVLPIPQGEDIVYQEVNVDGGAGTLLLSEEENTYTLIWVKNGILYALTGSGDKDAALPFVSTLQ